MEQVVKAKISRHIKPATTLNKDIVLDRYKRYLSCTGLREETAKLYVVSSEAFLDYAQIDFPDMETSDAYRNQLIYTMFSKNSISNRCPSIRKLSNE